MNSRRRAHRLPICSPARPTACGGPAASPRSGALTDYVATLRSIAASPELNLTASDKIEVEQATFLLEGHRDGLLTADFKDRADKIQLLIRTLNGIVERYNADASG